MKLLLIEDDPSTADFITKGFGEVGATIDHADNGLDGLGLATTQSYDVLIVDRMIPTIDGLNVVKTLRAEGVQTPVIFLSALGGLRDRVTGLDEGGDDYLVKPFAFSELHARVSALARRPPMREEPATELRASGAVLDRIHRTLLRGDASIELKPTEFKILEVLFENAGSIVTRTMLLEQVWDFHFDPKSSVVETHISRLRSKVDDGCETSLIRTVRGAGYIIDVDR